MKSHTCKLMVCAIVGAFSMLAAPVNAAGPVTNTIIDGEGLPRRGAGVPSSPYVIDCELNKESHRRCARGANDVVCKAVPESWRFVYTNIGIENIREVWVTRLVTLPICQVPETTNPDSTSPRPSGAGAATNAVGCPGYEFAKFSASTQALVCWGKQNKDGTVDSSEGVTIGAGGTAHW